MKSLKALGCVMTSRFLSAMCVPTITIKSNSGIGPLWSHIIDFTIARQAAALLAEPFLRHRFYYRSCKRISPVNNQWHAMTSLELIAQGLLRAGDVRERIHYLRVTGLTTIVPEYPTGDVKLVTILRKFVTNSMDDVEGVQFEAFLKSYLRSDQFRAFKENGDFQKVQRSIEEWKASHDAYFAKVRPDDQQPLTPIVPVPDSEDSHDLPFEKLAYRFLRRRSMSAEDRFQFIHFLGYEYLGMVNLLAGFRLQFIDMMNSHNNLPLERLVMDFLDVRMNQQKWGALTSYLGYDLKRPASYENFVQTRRIIGTVKYWRQLYSTGAPLPG